jgi:phage protein D/phage baseplate assembly protein gpV
MSTLAVAKPRVEVEGAPLPEGMDQLVETIVIDDSHTLPDMFTLRFRDPLHEVLAGSGLKLGAKVQIFAGKVGDVAGVSMILGEVTALEAELDETGTHVVVRGYDISHRLQRGLYTRTFADTTEAAIVRSIASDAGIDIGEIDDAPGQLPFVSQANQTNLEFLRARARETGYDLAVRDGKLYFQPPTASSSAPGQGSLTAVTPLQLVYGNNLNAFMPRITAAEQVGEVEVRGWDPGQQQVVLGNASASTSSVDVGDLSPASVAALFGTSKYVVGDRPLSEASEVQRVADAVAEQIGSAFAEADGVADGNPLLRAGTAISIAGVGHPFEGQYTVTASRHVIGPRGYHTHFTVSGRQERSLLGLASQGDTSGQASAGGEPIQGVVIAIVTNSDDPTKAGRVKLKFPWLADDYESDWARTVAVGAGANRGIAFLPEVGDEVLVAFERGDVRSPFVLGALWSTVNPPPRAGKLNAGGAINERVLVSREGHRVVFSDDDSNGGISIMSGDDNYAINILVSQQKIQIQSSGEIEITATTDLTLKGQSVKISGSTIDIEADATLQLKGGLTSISGTPLKLN